MIGAKRRSRAKTLIILAAVVAAPAAARDWFVAVDGDDTWSTLGTIDDPFASISRAMWDAAAGDRVLLRGGVHTGAAWIDVSGTPSQPLIIEPYQQEHVIFDGADDPPSTSVIGIDASCVIIRGLEVRNSQRTGISVWAESGPSVGVEIRNNVVHGCYRGGIFLGHGEPNMTWVQDAIVAGNTVYDSCLMNAEHVLASGWPGAIVAAKTTGVILRGNTVYANHGEGLILGLSDGGVAEDNVVYDNYSVNIYLDNATSCTVQRNFVYHTGDDTFDRFGYPASGVQLANEDPVGNGEAFGNASAGNVIINNVFSGVRNGLHWGNYQLGGGLQSTLFAHNTIYAAEQTAIDIDDDTHHNSRIVGNIVAQIGAVPPALLDGDLTGVQFDHNLWFGGTPPVAAQGLGDVNADPLLAVPGGNDPQDYAPQANSPAAGAGVALAEVVTDFRGDTRPPPPDLGAFNMADCISADVDLDGDVDLADLLSMQICAAGATPVAGDCACRDLSGDGVLTIVDVQAWRVARTGPTLP